MNESTKEITKKLLNIQQELKAPKGQRNNFGNYDYRSAEDILTAVKPLLLKNKCVLTLTDNVVCVGSRNYVEAMAKLSDGVESIQVAAMAREAESRKGMDDSQITGATSSYARKYALNGLFAIDDTKDADTMDNRNTSRTSSKVSRTKESFDGVKLQGSATEKQLNALRAIAIKKGYTFNSFVTKYAIDPDTITAQEASDLIGGKLKIKG